jgi:hypothetical protein
MFHTSNWNCWIVLGWSADHETPLYPQKFALTSPTSGGRSVGIVCTRTKAAELLVIITHIDSLAVKFILVYNRIWSL